VCIIGLCREFFKPLFTAFGPPDTIKYGQKPPKAYIPLIVYINIHKLKRDGPMKAMHKGVMKLV
jgi:hypothetical protein